MTEEVTPGQIATVPALVAGEWLRGGPHLDRVGPYLRRVVSRATAASPADVTRAVGYAPDAARAVGRVSPAARADVLDRAARLATERRNQLAEQLAVELGKPVKDGRGEVDRVADTLAVCAAEARRIGGELLPVAGWGRGVGNTALTYRAPAGVALAITPFNAPANLLAHKLGASFAAGNTTIVKAPPQAPASSAALVSLLLDAGLPVEAVQLLHGGGDVGAQLCAADEVAVISFTGSAATGAAVARAAGPKRLVLELGGNAATIVCEDADVQAAARVCARTGYSNSGQSCISVQRVYVQRDRFTEFTEALTAEVAKLRVGDPLDDATDVGSMVDVEAAERVVRWTAEAAAGGPGSCSAGPATAPSCTRPWWQLPRPPRPSWCTRYSAPSWPYCPTTRSARSSRRATPAGTACRPACSPATSAASSPPGGNWRWAGSWSTGRPTSGLTMFPSAA